MTEPVYTAQGASFSPDRRYRYTLYRAWNDSQYYDRSVLFLMLNPSTADETVLDPTVRRCVGFAQAWGFGRMEVANIFALRSTDPKFLREVSDPVGPENDWNIGHAMFRSDLVIAAWGTHGSYLDREAEVIEKFTEYRDLYCLGRSKGGHPLHPLYQKKDIKPIMYHMADEPSKNTMKVRREFCG